MPCHLQYYFVIHVPPVIGYPISNGKHASIRIPKSNAFRCFTIPYIYSNWISIALSGIRSVLKSWQPFPRPRSPKA